MNRVFGIMLCFFSLVGLVSTPVLAAINCAMKCHDMQPTVEMTQGTDILSFHCQEMKAAALATIGLVQVEDNSVDVGDTGCKCPDSCNLTAPAVLAHVEVPLSQHLNGDIVMSGPCSIEETFPRRLYRPPIA